MRHFIEEIPFLSESFAAEVDIWSLGIILYCLLTGTLPFDDDDEARMREKIIIGKFDIPDWLSPGTSSSPLCYCVAYGVYRCPGTDPGDSSI